MTDVHAMRPTLSQSAIDSSRAAHRHRDARLSAARHGRLREHVRVLCGRLRLARDRGSRARLSVSRWTGPLGISRARRASQAPGPARVVDVRLASLASAFARSNLAIARSADRVLPVHRAPGTRPSRVDRRHRRRRRADPSTNHHPTQLGAAGASSRSCRAQDFSEESAGSRASIAQPQTDWTRATDATT